MADKDDFVMKSVKKQLFGEAEGRRSANSPMREGSPQRRAPTPRREVSRGGRRANDLLADPKQTVRDLRVTGTDAGGAATASGRGTIVSAPVQRRVAAKAAGSTIGSSTGILRKAGRLGKIAAAAIAAYGAYKAWKDK